MKQAEVDEEEGVLVAVLVGVVLAAADAHPAGRGLDVVANAGADEEAEPNVRHVVDVVAAIAR